LFLISFTKTRYFARDSITWNGGGVAFLNKDHSVDSETHGIISVFFSNLSGRMYLITSDQFHSVVKQENTRLDFHKNIDFNALIKAKAQKVSLNSVITNKSKGIFWLVRHYPLLG
jgi:hypothetical protein